MIIHLITKQKKNRIIKSYGSIFLSAVLYTIGLHVFLQNAKTFSSGITAFAAFWTFIYENLVPFVSIIVWVLNIPLLIFSYFKNNKRFTRRTGFFLLAQVALGSLFIIPAVNDLLTTNIIVSNEDLEKKKWAILILAIIGSILMGFGIAISWMFGGSTGGIDIITYYFSSRRQREIGTIMSMISILILLFSFLITIIFNEIIRQRWLITLFASCTYILIIHVLISMIYPKYKKIEITISSHHIGRINQALKKQKYWHAWSLEEKISGFSNQSISKIKTIMFLLEAKDFIRFIKAIEPQAFITIKRIYKLIGHLNAKNVEGDF